ncbi:MULTISPECIES: thermonuclease family protein [unclassified Halobacteriovorax]|uniref:thermonuclease family protein n=1 Tax=unclassified Halobacteriovorax TaxID=2639665 RepID=UPI00399C3DAC
MTKIKLLLLALLQLSIYAISFEGKVLYIHDGDTMTVYSDFLGKKKNIRMLGIDTPEVDFNGNTQGQISLDARDFLRSLVPIGSMVTIDLGRDGDLNTRRLLGTVLYKGQDINYEMLKSGLAVPYFIEPFDKEIMYKYMEISERVFLEEIGLYALGVQLPYEFRMSVQNRVGTNYVGDLKTKILYSPEDGHLVPPYRRLFIRSFERAMQLGYKLFTK